MLRFLLHRFQAAAPILAGAALARQHGMALLEEVRRSPTALDEDGPGEIVVIDFEGYTSATGSYLRALLFQFIRGGKSATGAQQLNAFAVVRNLSPLIAEELAEVTMHRDPDAKDAKRVILEVMESRGDEIVRARQFGSLDPAQHEALVALQRRGGATATDLHAELSPSINITAFNNRLNDLHRLRLVRRHRAGRQWIYEPIAKEITRWASSS